MVVVDGPVPAAARPPGTARRDAAVALAGAALVCSAIVLVAGSTTTALAGALAGLGIVAAAGGSLMRRAGRWSGPADRVSLARVVLAAGCTTVAVPMVAGVLPERTWLLELLLVPALALDAVDGRVARWTGTASAAGGKLDGELDAAVLMVASTAAVRGVGWWVLGIGLMRYAFWVAGVLRPRLRGRLEYSAFRRWVAGVQGAALAVALAPVVPPLLGAVCAAVALALLTVSFGLDVVTLERRRAARRVTSRASTPAQDPASSRCR